MADLDQVLQKVLDVQNHVNLEPVGHDVVQAAEVVTERDDAKDSLSADTATEDVIRTDSQLTTSMGCAFGGDDTLAARDAFGNHRLGAGMISPVNYDRQAA